MEAIDEYKALIEKVFAGDVVGELSFKSAKETKSTSNGVASGASDHGDDEPVLEEHLLDEELTKAKEEIEALKAQVAKYREPSGRVAGVDGTEPVVKKAVLPFAHID